MNTRIWAGQRRTTLTAPITRPIVCGGAAIRALLSWKIPSSGSKLVCSLRQRNVKRCETRLCQRRERPAKHAVGPLEPIGLAQERLRDRSDEQSTFDLTVAAACGGDMSGKHQVQMLNKGIHRAGSALRAGVPEGSTRRHGDIRGNRQKAISRRKVACRRFE